MVDVIGRAKVIISGDVDPRSIDQAGGKIGSRLKAGAVVGVAALGTLAVAGVKAYKSFEEAEAQSRKLTQVLDNMGKSDAAPAVEKLADDLMRLTGIDDEVIKGGQTILATFSQVAESAGDVGGTFERATKAAIDMSAAGFGSVESASVMLGKALQDPVKGVTALVRAGVTFTAEQKELIKSLVETGDAGKAQALILAEVEKQVGGTGDASATESEKISAAMGEIKEAAGGAIAALLGGEEGESLSDVLFDVADSIEKTADSEGWEKFGEQLENLNDDTENSETFLGKWADSMRTSGKSLLDLLDTVTTTAPKFRDRFSDHGKIWSDWGKLIGNVIDNVIDGFKDYLKWQAQVGDAPVNVPDSVDVSQPRETRAGGGPIRGLALVGENGPELAQFGDSGGYVYNNSQTREILAAASGDTYVNNFNITGPTSLAELRQQADWYNTYGTRFGGST